MRQYDWERRQKTNLERLVKEFKKQLVDNGFLTKGPDFTLAIKTTAVGEGFFKTLEHIEGVLDRFSEFDEFKKFIYNELQADFNERLDDEVREAVESVKHKRDEFKADLDMANTTINRLEAEIERLKGEK